MSDFVKPEPERLTLSGGHFIDIKKRLNHGEREDLFAAMSRDIVPGEPARLDRRIFRTAKVVAYLLGWSLTDDGKPVAYSPELPEQERINLLRNLSPERFDEIHTAITAHEEGATASKKIIDGVTESSATSPSRSDAAGVTAMSAS